MTRTENRFAAIKTEITTVQSAMENSKSKDNHQIEESKKVQRLMEKRLEGIEKQISANAKPTGKNRLQIGPSMTNKTNTGTEGNEVKSYASAVQAAKNEAQPSTSQAAPGSSSAEMKTYRRKGHNRMEKSSNRSSTVPNQDAGSGSGDNHLDAKKGYRLYSKRKCLLIHDSTFEDFHQEKFSKQLNVTPFSAKKASIAVKSKKLQDLLKSENPDCVYIHLGLHDIIGGDVDSTLCSFEELLELMLESTAAKICFSLVVPTSNNAALNEKINELNQQLNLMVTTMRSDQENLRERLFTYNNSSVAWLNKKSPQGVHLTERGKLVMWTKLKDGLRKTLRLPRPYLNNPNSSNRQNNSRNE